MILVPIYVVSTGRSGSTLAMKVLSLHPAIVARSIYPYETRASQYFFACALAGRAEADFRPVSLTRVTYRPHQGADRASADWCQTLQDRALGPWGQRLTERYYRFVAQLSDKRGPSHFAEKTIGLATAGRLAHELSDARLVFLSRDPRDTFLSIKAFNAKRGFLAFGEDRGDEAMLDQLLRHYEAAAGVSRTLGTRAISVRYEDLVTRSEVAIATLYDSLDLDGGDVEVAAIAEAALRDDADLRRHRSAASVAESVGRWRVESSPDAMALFGRFEGRIRAMGY